MKDFPDFPYIRTEAKEGGTGLSEAELRRMLAMGKLPGFYCGPKMKYFRINHRLLVEMLNEQSKRV